MRLSSFISFFGIALGVYGAVNLFIWLHLARVVPYLGVLKAPVVLAFWTLVAALPAGRIGGAFCRCAFTDRLTILGSWYLGFMVYVLLLLILADAVRLADHWIKIVPRSPAGGQGRATIAAFWGVLFLSVVIVAAGRWNARNPVVREYDLPVKGTPREAPLRVAVVSDLHVGLLVRNHWLADMIETINSTHPDMVLLVGDIVDSDVTRAQEERLSEQLETLSAPLGVFAVLGNHEFYSGADEAARSFIEGGVTVLRDRSVVIDGAMVLVGRDDRTASRMGRSRSPLAAIDGIGGDLPVIVMDHTPHDLHEAEEAGVALQVSGHTHRGQLWPFNYITSKIFEQDWGFLKKGDTLFYISCGVGAWGPPIRTSSRPEVVVLNISFQ